MRDKTSLFGEVAYGPMRVVFGILFAAHGVQKLLPLFRGESLAGEPLILAAGVIELLGGALVALGLFARYAAFIASGQMAVAYFMMHAPRGFWPHQNEGELAVLYCFAFLFIAGHGAGSFSLDSLRATRHVTQLKD